MDTKSFAKLQAPSSVTSILDMLRLNLLTEEVFGNYATRQKSAAAVCSAIYWRDLYYDEKGRKPCCQMSVRLFDTKKANQRLIR
jgi:hypothetical protein